MIHVLNDFAISDSNDAFCDFSDFRQLRCSEVSAYDALIRRNVVEMIDALGASLGRYRCEDGSYSFLQSGSSPTIYSTPVSLGVKEGDVNGNNLVVLLGTHMSAAVGLSELIPIFNENHAALFRKLLDNAPKTNKKSITSDSYASFTFESDAVGATPADQLEPTDARPSAVAIHVL